MPAPVGRLFPPLAGFRDDFTHTAPVGSFAANPFGLFDLGGNACEWCEDWLDPAAGDPVRVYRDEGLAASRESDLRSSKRWGLGPTFKVKKTENSGFRAVLAPVPSAP